MCSHMRWRTTESEGGAEGVDECVRTVHKELQTEAKTQCASFCSLLLLKRYKGQYAERRQRRTEAGTCYDGSMETTTPGHI